MSLTIYMPTHEFYPKRGGIGVYIEELARAAALEASVTVFAPQDPALQSKAFPFTLEPLPIRGNQNLPNVIKTLFRLRQACLHNPNARLLLAEPGPIRAGMLGIALGKLPNNPIQLVLHGSEMQQFYARADLCHLFQKLLHRAERIGVVSRYNRNWLTEHFKVSKERIQLVPGALRHNFVPSQNSAPQTSHERVQLLSVGRIHPRKGQLATLEAIALLPARKQQQIYLRFVGPTSDEAYAKALQDMARTMATHVQFDHELSDDALREAYAQADMFIMTSMPHKRSIEGLGMVYLEAGAHGVPSIAHDIGGVSDAVIHEQTGLLAPPGDRAALAAALNRLIEDQDMRKNFGNAAREHAFAHTWQDNVDRLFKA